MADTKIHDIDEKLDRLETLIALFESKIGSLPDEAFEHEPMPPEDDEDVNDANL